MSLRAEPPHHRTYLLTYWEERSEDTDVPGTWRFRLEDPHSGLQHGFTTLGELVAYLQRELTDKQEYSE
jgi:hypothetical protein